MSNERTSWILCVDDDEDILLIRKLLLEQGGYEVLTACDADSAMSILSMVKVDLVLTDNILQGRSGSELAADIKGTYPGTPVVLQSGGAELLDVTEHIDALLSKAEDPTVLLDMIAALLPKISASPTAIS